MLGFGDATGSGVKACEDFYSGGLDYCIGWEKSCPDGDKCCPQGEWFNEVYGDVVGRGSLRKLREDKIDVARSVLLDVDAGGDMGIELYAYDAGATVPPLFLTAVQQSFSSYRACFPAARFSRDPDEAKTDCGTYAGYDEDLSYWPKPRLDALERASDVTLSTTFRQLAQTRGVAPYGKGSAHQHGQSAEVVPDGPLGVWWERVRTLVAGVPSGRDGEMVADQPRLEDLVVVEGGVVRPSNWLHHFIATFLPKRAPIGARPTAGRHDPSPWASPPARGWTAKPVPRDPPSGTPSGQAAIGTAAVVGIGLVVATGGYFLARKVL